MICTNEINRICIAQPHHQVIVKDVTLDMALGAFKLNGKVKYSTMRYRVFKARERGTYDRQRAAFVASLVADYCAQKNQEIDGLVIDLTTNANSSSMDLSSVSTGTMVTLATGTTDAGTGGSSEVLSVSSSEEAPPEKTKRTRKTNSLPSKLSEARNQENQD